MPLLLFFLHGGPWGQGGGPGADGWGGPPFGFFRFIPFFGLFPILFWGGLLFFIFSRVSRGHRGRGRGWGGGMTPPAASRPAPTTPAGPHGPAWPDLDPAGSVQMPPSAPKGADLEKRGDVEYV